MNSHSKLSCAIAAILSGNVAGFAFAAPATDPEVSVGEIQEITVTATRRSENLQNVPITIQALTAETLTQLNAATFDDYMKYVPNVTAAGLGPGQGQIYMRGLATTTTFLQAAGSEGSFPNVAVYLDDQSAQLPGRNMDIYAADLERIEVLEGPQGTLFGAGAQAGVIRYITNKPKLNATEAAVNAGYATTAHGDPSSNVDAMLNLPLIPDTLAVRAVIYDDSRGGYINNLPGTFTRSGNDLGIVDYFGGTRAGNTVITPGVVPPNSPSLSNSNMVGSAINPVTYKGMRLSGLYQFHEDWNLLLAQSYQDMHADGVFSEQALGSNGEALPALSAQLYNPSSDTDKFSNTAWTLNGRIDQLKVVYTGGYLVRKIEQTMDYTNYARGIYADYYQCMVPGMKGAPACFSPSSVWHDSQKNTHQSHELRLSTPDDWRLRAIGGLFWEDYKVQDTGNWLYAPPAAGWTVPVQPPDIPGINDPSARPPGTSFFDDITRGYKQKAAFTSVDYEIIPKTLTLTAGTRYYDMNTYEQGVKFSGYGCRPGGIYTSPSLLPTAPSCSAGALNLDALGLQKTYTGFKSRFNLSWNITGDALVYATWSQGFRPGGFNRGTGVVSGNSPLAGIWSVPKSFAPDTLTNKEIGWKTQWLDHRLQFNGAVYKEEWHDVQTSIFNPGVFGNLTFATNGPNYQVKGVEAEVIARVTTQLTVTGSASWNTTKLVNNPALVCTNPTTQASEPCPPVGDPFGAVGSPLAMAPPFQGNIRVRYDFKFNDYNAFWQLAGTHQAHSYSTTDDVTKDLQGHSIAYENAPFSTMDASIGVAKDAWTAQLYGQNLTDTKAELYSNYNQWVKNTTVNRPRTLGLKFGYKF